MKTAIITGIQGQDGAFLAQLLLEKGYKVYGADRRRVDPLAWRLKDLGIADSVEFVYMDLLDYGSIHKVINEIKPDEIYNLAAQSFVKASFDQPMLTADVDALGPLRILEAIRLCSPNTRLYQASTSEMFGDVLETPQKETTPFNPRSPYGVAKLFAHEIVKNYRDSYGYFVCSGILFNHESEYRGIEFVTKKITNYVARYKMNQVKEPLYLGNLEAKRDWGYAGDYVEAMYLMLQRDSPDDYVISTGITHTIKEFVDLAFESIDVKLRWSGSGIDTKALDSSGNEVIRISEEYFRPAEVDLLLGDSTKAKSELNWSPRTTLKQMVDIMVDFDIKDNAKA